MRQHAQMTVRSLAGVRTLWQAPPLASRTNANSPTSSGMIASPKAGNLVTDSSCRRIPLGASGSPALMAVDGAGWADGRGIVGTPMIGVFPGRASHLHLLIMISVVAPSGGQRHDDPEVRPGLHCPLSQGHEPLSQRRY